MVWILCNIIYSTIMLKLAFLFGWKVDNKNYCVFAPCFTGKAENCQLADGRVAEFHHGFVSV